MHNKVAEWMIPATGDCAPERMLVAVRAIAPVAGSPPKSGEAIFATPCPINSTLGLCRSLLMRSETTADMSDSIAPEQRHGHSGSEQAVNQIRMKLRNGQVRQATRDTAEARTNSLDRKLEKENRIRSINNRS
jgi:hypothetical protein